MENLVYHDIWEKNPTVKDYKSAIWITEVLSYLSLEISYIPGVPTNQVHGFL